MRKPKETNLNDTVDAVSDDKKVKTVSISLDKRKEELMAQLKVLQDKEKNKNNLSPEEQQILEQEKKELSSKIDDLKADKHFQDLMDTIVDRKISFAKVNWGVGKGPYILAFENSCDSTYCEANSHEFKPLKDHEIRLNHVHIWECGAKTPEEIDKLPTLDMKKYFDIVRTERQKKKEEKENKKKENLENSDEGI